MSGFLDKLWEEAKDVVSDLDVDVEVTSGDSEIRATTRGDGDVSGRIGDRPRPRAGVLLAGGLAAGLLLSKVLD